MLFCSAGDATPPASLEDVPKREDLPASLEDLPKPYPRPSLNLSRSLLAEVEARATPGVIHTLVQSQQQWSWGQDTLVAWPQYQQQWEPDSGCGQAATARRFRGSQATTLCVMMFTIVLIRL